jgi:hypothetical protein
VEGSKLEDRSHSSAGGDRDTLDLRQHPRFKIEVDVRITSKTCGRLKGHTVDVSESGISAMLTIEVPIGEVVELEFTLPFGPVRIYALVRQRNAFRYGFQNAFRYGFQFVELNASHVAIEATCHQLAIERTLLGEL